MKKLQTEIIINASAAKVWTVLMDFSSYPQWNPFVQKIDGKAVVGEKLRVELKNGKGVSVFKPTVMICETEHKFEWLGSLPIPGIFNGQHYFHIEPISTTQVKFIHGENFSGLLAGLIMNQIGQQTEQGFIAMNKALKARAEQTA